MIIFSLEFSLPVFSYFVINWHSTSFNIATVFLDEALQLWTKPNLNAKELNYETGFKKEYEHDMLSHFLKVFLELH